MLTSAAQRIFLRNSLYATSNTAHLLYYSTEDTDCLFCFSAAANFLLFLIYKLNVITVGHSTCGTWRCSGSDLGPSMVEKRLFCISVCGSPLLPPGPSHDGSFHIFNKAHLLIVIDCVYCILYFLKNLQKPKVIQIFLYISP